MSQYPVKYIHSGMRGVPVVRNTPGSRIAAIDAFLITGFGMVTANAVSVSGGVATASLPIGQSFEPHCVIRISGATPAELNGEARVLTATDSEITFATAAGDGLASGSITIQVAPVGHWEKAFTGPHVAVYRSTHPESLGMFWRVDDSQATHMRVRGYTDMSDVDTGVGPFPTPASAPLGAQWLVATNNANTRLWWDFVADARFFLAAFAQDPYNYQGPHNSAPPVGFGDLLGSSTDRWCAGLAMRDSGGGADGSFAQPMTSPSGNTGIALAANARGEGGAQAAVVGTYCGLQTSTSGGESSQGLGAAPNPVDGHILLSPLFVRAGSLLANDPRADVPGLLYCPQRGAHLIFNGRDTLDGAGPLAGRRLLTLPLDAYHTTKNPRGCYMVDTTGPWR